MSTTSSSRPLNVVVFLADDLGWGDLGCFGSTRIPTPRIDALARRGVKFSDCHASSAVCTPSRYSLLTGSYPWRSPLQSGVLGGTDPCIVSDDLTTLPKALHQSGYATGAFGKWHLGMDWTTLTGERPTAFGDQPFLPHLQASGREIDYQLPVTRGPLTSGFDRFFGIAGSLDMPPYCFIEQDRTRGIPDREKSPLVTSQRPGLEVEGWQDDEVDTQIVRAACEWMRLRSEEQEPFFAYVASAAPHRPCVPPDFVKGRSQAGSRGDSVCLVDWMVGEIVDELDRAGILENTLLVVTSDNGAPTMFAEDGDVEHHRPNGPWRGQKADAWEGGHRVPLIMCGPEVPAEGTTLDDPVSLVDLFPTVLDLLGIPGGPELGGAPLQHTPVPGDGKSFFPLLTKAGTLAGVNHSERVFGQNAFDGSLVLRRGNNKAIFSTGSGGFSDPVGNPLRYADKTVEGGQFYDLCRDPAETDNLWNSSATLIDQMYGEFCEITGFDQVPLSGTTTPARVKGSETGAEL